MAIDLHLSMEVKSGCKLNAGSYFLTLLQAFIESRQLRSAVATRTSGIATAQSVVRIGLDAWPGSIDLPLEKVGKIFLNIGRRTCIENNRFLLDDVGTCNRNRGERSGCRGHRSDKDFQVLKMSTTRGPIQKLVVGGADLEIANPYLIYFGTSRTLWHQASDWDASSCSSH